LRYADFYMIRFLIVSPMKLNNIVRNSVRMMDELF